MIIDFLHSFKNYNEILEFYGIWECSCPKCGAKHSLHRHAKYSRNLIFWDTEALTEMKIDILRLQCCSCNSTHAVLTPDMIPFCTYSLGAFLKLISLCLEPDGSVLKTEQHTGVSYQLLYRFLLIFHEFRERLILFLRNQSLWSQTEHPFSRNLLYLLYSLPPPKPSALFFEMFRRPLFLHRQNTPSYPLRFGVHHICTVPPT